MSWGLASSSLARMLASFIAYCMRTFLGVIFSGVSGFQVYEKVLPFLTRSEMLVSWATLPLIESIVRMGLIFAIVFEIFCKGTTNFLFLQIKFAYMQKKLYFCGLKGK